MAEYFVTVQPVITQTMRTGEHVYGVIPMSKWCEDNDIKSDWRGMSGGMTEFRFNKEEDAVLFKLRYC
jgi:hypothetical protein